MSEVIVRSVGQKLTQEIIAGQEQEHHVLSDEPSAEGGENRGPTPYDFLLGSLGSCTAITLFMYARRKNWDLTGVRVKLKHDRVHAKDCVDCEKKTGFIDRIDREISLEGNLDESQRERLLYIAQHCPVHKTLTNEIRINDKLNEALAA